MGIKIFLKKSKFLFFVVKFLKIRIFKINSEIDTILLKKLKFDSAIDIGSNYGSYTSILRDISKKVISVEPNLGILNLQKKILGDNKIDFYNVAIGKKNGEVILNIPIKKNSLIYEEAFISNKIVTQQYLKVNQRNGDDLFLNSKSLDFIKIDVEGYENQVLKSLSKSIKKFLPVILIEIEVRHSTKIKINELINDLKEMEYNFFFMKSGKTLSIIKNFNFKLIKELQNEFNHNKDKHKSIYNLNSTKCYINNFWCFNKKKIETYDEILSQFRI